MIRIERTRDRRVQHLFIKELYIGSYDSGVIYILPQWKKNLEKIKAVMTARLSKYEVKVGVPALRYLPAGWEKPGSAPARPPGEKAELEKKAYELHQEHKDWKKVCEIMDHKTPWLLAKRHEKRIKDTTTEQTEP